MNKPLIRVVAILVALIATGTFLLIHLAEHDYRFSKKLKDEKRATIDKLLQGEAVDIIKFTVDPSVKGKKAFVNPSEEARQLGYSESDIERLEHVQILLPR
jgi:hypothetical protein